MTDTALVQDGLVVQVWKATPKLKVPAPDVGELIEFDAVTAGMAWDGIQLSASPSPVHSWGGLETAWVEDVAAAKAEKRFEISAERDRRLAEGFVDSVTGKTWQCDVVSQGKWTAIGSSAGIAVLAASSRAFPVIAADNSLVSLDEVDAYALFDGRVLPWVAGVMITARAIKDMNPIPADITDDSLWPA